MLKLKSLLAAAILFLSLGYVGPVNANSFVENPKFLTYGESVLGLNSEELKEALGEPREITEDGCMVPYKAEANAPITPLTGTGWMYEHESRTTYASLYVCVVKGYAVAEQRELGRQNGTRLQHTTHQAIDSAIIERALKGELDEGSKEDRTALPKHNGPKHEI